MTRDGFSLHASARHFSTSEFLSYALCYLYIERGKGYLFHYLQRVLNCKLKGKKCSNQMPPSFLFQFLG